MLDQLLAPFDYPRQALYNLGRTGYRALTGEAGLEDLASAAPGMLGLAGMALGGPMAGILAGGLMQGAGKLTGANAFEAPTSSHLLEAMGADPESPWTQAGSGALHVMTDPLMMEGILKGAGWLGGAMSKEAPMVQAAGGLGGKPSVPMLSPMAETGAPTMASMPPDLIPMLRGGAMSPQEVQALHAAADAKMAAQQPWENMHTIVDDGGIQRMYRLPETPGPLMRELGVPPEEPLAQAAAGAGPAPAASAPGYPGSPLQGRQPIVRGMEEKLAADYQGNAGMLRDQMGDMLGQGYAGLDDRLAAATHANDFINDAAYLRSAGMAPPVTAAEAEALLMRKAMAQTDQAVDYLTPKPAGQFLGAGTTGPLSDLADHASTHANAFGGANQNTPAGLLTREMVNASGFSGAPGELMNAINGVGAEGAAMAADQGGLVEAANSLTRNMAEARMGSPELRLAERQARELEALMEGQLGPQQTAALVQELRQYGLPIDPAEVMRQYPKVVSEASLANNVEAIAHQGALGYNPAYMDAETEAAVPEIANQLLRLLGPQRMNEMAQLSNHVGKVRDFGDYTRGVARHQMHPALVSELQQALQGRGLLG